MAGTGRRAEDTESCPYCSDGLLVRRPNGTISCSGCGAYYEKGILYRNSAERPAISNTQMFRIRKWRQRNRVANAAERSLAFAMSEIERMAASNNLSRKVIDSATEIYKKAVEKNLVRGRSTQNIIAASIYAACRSCGIPRTIEEVSENCDISKKELSRTYRVFRNGLKLDLLPADPREYAIRYCHSLGLSRKVQDYAVDLLDKATEKELMSGLGPSGIAAGAVYISAHLNNERRSQSQVAIAADISEVTLRCRYKDLAESFDITMEF